MTALTDRHPSTASLVRWFTFSHLPEGAARGVSQLFHTLAWQLLEVLPDGPELSAGLRKLLEAKDCAVRAAIAAAREDSMPGDDT